MTKTIEAKVTVPAWELIFWEDHGHGRHYEHRLEWLWDQAVKQNGLDAEALERGFADYSLLELGEGPQSQQVLVLSVVLEGVDE